MKEFRDKLDPDCPSCGGTGNIPVQRGPGDPAIPAISLHDEKTCPVCKGGGKAPRR